MNLRTFFVLLSLVVSTSASAAIFKSVDADGKVVYSDRPSDSNVQLSVIRAAVLQPVDAAKPASESDGAIRKVAFLGDAAQMKPVASAMAARGLNERGELCAKIAAQNLRLAAKATAAAAYSVPSK